MEKNDIDQLEIQAIEAALANKWDLAIDLNKKILKIEKNKVQAQLRLAFAYLQKGEIEKAKKTYQSVLKIQPGNTIARDNFEKIKVLNEKKLKKINQTSLSYLDPNIFLEVPGKTAIIELINLGQKNILAQLSIGQRLILKIRKRKIEARTESNAFVGFLPDDISRRLTFFIKAKSQYSCYIKEIALKKVIVFIKEEEKGEKVTKFVSFPKNLQSNLEALKRTDTEVDTDSYEKDRDDILTNEIEDLAEKLDDETQFSDFDLREENETEEEE
jgi:tetratricopeptide (TPR) repeat protein